MQKARWSGESVRRAASNCAGVTHESASRRKLQLKKPQNQRRNATWFFSMLVYLLANLLEQTQRLVACLASMRLRQTTEGHRHRQDGLVVSPWQERMIDRRSHPRIAAFFFFFEKKRFGVWARKRAAFGARGNKKRNSRRLGRNGRLIERRECDATKG
jgi:hypothetical protein